jgi:hypothetical protein
MIYPAVGGNSAEVRTGEHGTLATLRCLLPKGWWDAPDFRFRDRQPPNIASKVASSIVARRSARNAMSGGSRVWLHQVEAPVPQQ